MNCLKSDFRAFFLFSLVTFHLIDAKADNNQIDDVIRKQLLRKDEHQSFFVIDVEAAIDRVKLWRQTLPRIRSYYCIKTNPNLFLLELYTAFGFGFDSASKREMKIIRDLDYPTNRIIYSHTQKRIPHLEFARRNGVDFTIFDNFVELEKMAKYHPKAKLLMRIQAKNPSATVPLGKKFGVDLENVPALLKRSLELKMIENIVGVHFHVGSNVTSSDSYSEDLQRVRQVFDMAWENFGHQLRVVDIGGGFPGEIKLNSLFIEITKKIKNSIKTLFPRTDSRFSNVEFMAEPGRFYSASSFHLVTRVIGKNDENTEREQWLYLNDGIYQSFYVAARYNFHLHPKLVEMSNFKSKYNYVERHLVNTTLYGQTCDGHDAILTGIALPKTDVGEAIKFPEHGAYSDALGGNFNGYELPYDVYYVSRTAKQEMKKLNRWTRLEKFFKNQPFVYYE